MAAKPGLGDIVLLRTAEKRYSPAIVNRITPEGAFNLTVFDPQGSTSPANNVVEGDNVGNWAPTGVDAKEAPIKPPQTGTLRDLERK